MKFQRYLTEFVSLLIDVASGSSSLAQVQICTREYTAMSYCDTSGNTTPSGYEIHFINSILGSLVSNGNTAYVDIAWNCMPDVPSIMDQLALPAGNRTCDIGIGSIAQSSLGLGEIVRPPLSRQPAVINLPFVIIRHKVELPKLGGGPHDPHI